MDVRHEDAMGIYYSHIKIGTPEWNTWLGTAASFRYDNYDYSFTARNEKRRGKSGYWYAYRTFGKKTYKKYIGGPEAITMQRLGEVGRELAALITQLERKS